MNTATASIADLIAPELPYLRRYARALCGTQDRGDNFVVATLEAMIADPSIFRLDLSPKTALYRSFISVWNSLPTNTTADRTATGQIASTADRRLEQITPLPRQAFLLAALEEMSPADIAVVLGKTEKEVVGLIDSASREISDQLAARVMIIEDEPMISLDIQGIIEEIGHQSVGIATTETEATKLAAKTKPDIILSDIQLADGSSGIDAVNKILKTQTMPVIFITAYPERLLTGERAEPTFLLTKPFQPAMLKAVISQALFFQTPPKAS